MNRFSGYTTYIRIKQDLCGKNKLILLMIHFFISTVITVIFCFVVYIQIGQRT